MVYLASRILKLSAKVIAPSLTIIFNQTILTGIFPNDWKIARITPIFKSDAKDKMTNYRPISVISIISKIAEKVSMTKSTTICIAIIYWQIASMDLDHFIQL